MTFEKEKKLGSMKHSSIREKLRWETEGKLPECVLSYDGMY